MERDEADIGLIQGSYASAARRHRLRSELFYENREYLVMSCRQCDGLLWIGSNRHSGGIRHSVHDSIAIIIDRGIDSTEW